MQVACPNCSTRYNVPDSAAAERRQRLKCAVCATVWTIEPGDALDDEIEQPVSEPVDGDNGVSSVADEEGGISASETSDDEPAEASLDIDSNLGFDDEETPPLFGDDPEGHAVPLNQTRKITIKRKRGDRRPMIAAVAAGTLVLLGALISYRDAVVSVYPQSAGLFAMIGMPVNLRGLVFEEIVTERAVENGVDVLNIKGQIVSIDDQPTPIPALRFSMRDSRNNEIYSWQSRLPLDYVRPGERLPFESQVIAPPPQGQSIRIFFVDTTNPLAAAGNPYSGS